MKPSSAGKTAQKISPKPKAPKMGAAATKEQPKTSPAMKPSSSAGKTAQKISPKPKAPKMGAAATKEQPKTSPAMKPSTSAGKTAQKISPKPKAPKIKAAGTKEQAKASSETSSSSPVGKSGQKTSSSKPTTPKGIAATKEQPTTIPLSKPSSSTDKSVEKASSSSKQIPQKLDIAATKVQTKTSPSAKPSIPVGKTVDEMSASKPTVQKTEFEGTKEQEKSSSTSKLNSPVDKLVEKTLPSELTSQKIVLDQSKTEFSSIHTNKSQYMAFDKNIQYNPSLLAMKRRLFTPGPLMVSDRVKIAMRTDMGRRHEYFGYVVKFVRRALLQIARVDQCDYSSILLDGSGSHIIEATLKSVFSSKKKLLVMENGSCGKAIADIAEMCHINTEVVPMNLKTLQLVLQSNNSNNIGGVAVAHCEASTGKINPVNEIGFIVKNCLPDCLYFVDGMTSFGAIPIDMKNVDFLLGNSCKSLHGVPGVSFAIANRESLKRHRGACGGLVLDMGAQHDELEETGHFRFTPPTHVMCALKEALLEYIEEGGLQGRAARYQQNTLVLKQEMKKMGFRQLYRDEENPDGYIVTAYHYPNVPQFVFKEFYERLSDSGNVISTEKGTAEDCFRIGCIGNVKGDDIRSLCKSIRDVCKDMRIDVPLKPADM